MSLNCRLAKSVWSTLTDDVLHVIFDNGRPVKILQTAFFLLWIMCYKIAKNPLSELIPSSANLWRPFNVIFLLLIYCITDLLLYSRYARVCSEYKAKIFLGLCKGYSVPQQCIVSRHWNKSLSVKSVGLELIQEVICLILSVFREHWWLYFQ